MRSGLGAVRQGVASALLLATAAACVISTGSPTANAAPTVDAERSPMSSSEPRCSSEPFDLADLPADTVVLAHTPRNQEDEPRPDLLIDAFGPDGANRLHVRLPAVGGGVTDEPFTDAVAIAPHHVAVLFEHGREADSLALNYDLVVIYDLAEPAARPTWVLPTAKVSVGPRGLIAVLSPDLHEITVLNPRCGTSITMKDRYGYWDAWTLDGSGLFLGGKADVYGASTPPYLPPNDGVFLIEDGAFHEVNPRPDLYRQPGLPNFDLSADGESLIHTAAYDDMGKGTAPSWIQSNVDPDAGRDDPGTTVWFDSETTRVQWFHVQWDVDGIGLLVIERDLDGKEPWRLVRYDRPGKAEVLGTIPREVGVYPEVVLAWAKPGSDEVQLLLRGSEFAADPGGGSSSTGRLTLFRYSSGTGQAVRIVGPVRHLSLVCGFECGR